MADNGNAKIDHAKSSSSLCPRSCPLGSAASLLHPPPDLFQLFLDSCRKLFQLIPEIVLAVELLDIDLRNQEAEFPDVLPHLPNLRCDSGTFNLKVVHLQ